MVKRLYTLYIIGILWVLNVSAQSAKVNIWQGTSVKAKVEMSSFLAPGSHNKAVIVCPGGSYFWHDMDGEGKKVGEWLQSNGISAFVLKYRTAGFMAFLTRCRYLLRGTQYPDALNDLRQAMAYVRKHADRWGVNVDSIGVMGFSAGGHLVMSAAEFGDTSERPSFVATIYPVVTMAEACVHKRSRRALLGEVHKNNRMLRDSLSLEWHVKDGCPPVFLVNCKDDPVVKYHNSELLDSALTAHQIPHRYIQYHTGGHGFGADERKGSFECRQWKQEFLNWLSSLGL